MSEGGSDVERRLRALEQAFESRPVRIPDSVAAATEEFMRTRDIGAAHACLDEIDRTVETESVVFPTPTTLTVTTVGVTVTVTVTVTVAAAEERPQAGEAPSQ